VRQSTELSCVECEESFTTFLGGRKAKRCLRCRKLHRHRLYLARRERERPSRFETNQSRLAAKWGINGSVTYGQFQALCQFHKNRCFYCGHEGHLEVDHAVPLSRGGQHRIKNIVPSCRRCNAAKGNKTLSEFLEREVV